MLPPPGWTVYHASRAGVPQLHGVAAGHPGEWHFQPDDGPAGEVWSIGYPTRAEAVAAAWAESGRVPMGDPWGEE